MILPLPLKGSFTYALPEAFASCVQVGCRLLVPFGKRKIYSGIVTALHDKQPDGYEVKEAQSMLDEEPVVLPQQLRLWQWIADYYLCTIGEVYKAALPSGLKEEDEKKTYKPRVTSCVRLVQSHVDLNTLNELLQGLQRSPKQQALLDAYIQMSGLKAAIKLSNPQLVVEVGKLDLLQKAGATSAVMSALVDKGIMEVYEKQV